MQVHFRSKSKSIKIVNTHKKIEIKKRNKRLALDKF